jgi:hypothetical protein
MVRPGELNLMTAATASAPEVPTPETTVPHGAQLWVALPSSARDDALTFDHYAPAAVTGDGWRPGSSSARCSATPPVATATPLLGAEPLLSAGTELHRRRPDVRARRGRHRRRLLGDVETGAELAYPTRPQRLTPRRWRPCCCSAARRSARRCGGTRRRSHEDVVAFRDAWMAQLADGADGRFGIPTGTPAADPRHRCPTRASERR